MRLLEFNNSTAARGGCKHPIIEIEELSSESNIERMSRNRLDDTNRTQ